jgi:SAM-dependent methyltransferase
MTERSYEGSELALFGQAIRWKAYWAEAIGPFLKGRVLEVGAGIGSNLAALQTAPVVDWTLLEPDRGLCDRIGQRIAIGELPGKARAICGIMRDLPPTPDFDTVLYIDVLEHIEDDRGEVEQAIQRLSPRGHLIILSPAYQALFSAFDAAIGHHRRYSRRSLLALAPPQAKLVKAFYLDSLGVLPSMANRFLLRQSMPTPASITFWDRAIVPLSRFIDPLIGFNAGRSVVAVWSKEAAQADSAP